MSQNREDQDVSLLVGAAAAAFRENDNLSVSQAGFVYLEQLLIEKGGLKSSRFIWILQNGLESSYMLVVTDLFIWKLAERFQRNTNTIHRAHHELLSIEGGVPGKAPW